MATGSPAPRAVPLRALDAYLAFNARRQGAWARVTRVGKVLGGHVLSPLVGMLSRGSGTIRSEECDVLFVHGWSGGERRSAPFAVALATLGLRVRHEVRSARLARLWRRELAAPASPVRGPWRLDVHYARFLLARYQPRVVIVFEYRSPFVSCLRAAASGAITVVNVAHSVVPPTDESNMFDADYYFVYGPSSVQHCLGKRVRVGSTKLVQTGSVLRDAAFFAGPPPAGTRVLFLSQLSSELFDARGRVAQRRHLVQRNTAIVREFALRNPDLAVDVKPHPTETAERTSKAVGGVQNIRILEPSVGLREALEPAALVITMWSNASLEAAALGRAVVVVNDSTMPDDYLQLGRFFLPAARNAQELAEHVRHALAEPSEQARRSAAFVDWHLARTSDAASYAAGCIASLLAGREEFPVTPLPARLEGLLGYRG